MGEMLTRVLGVQFTIVATVAVDLCTFTGNSATGGDTCDLLPWLAGLPGGEGSGGAIFQSGDLDGRSVQFFRQHRGRVESAARGRPTQWQFHAGRLSWRAWR